MTDISSFPSHEGSHGGIPYDNAFLPAARGALDRLLVLKTACHGTSIIPGGPAGYLWAHIATGPRHSARVCAIVSPIENSEVI